MDFLIGLPRCKRSKECIGRGGPFFRVECGPGLA